MLCNNLWTDQRREVNSISGGDWENKVLSPSWSQNVRGWLRSRTWVPPSRAGSHTRQKERGETSGLGWDASWALPRDIGSGSTEGPPPAVSPWLWKPRGVVAAPQAPHPVCPLGPRGLICTGQGRGWAGLGAQNCRHAFHPLWTSSSWPDVQGREGITGWHETPILPPAHGNLKAQTAGGARDPDGERISPSFRWHISHFQGWVWARGPQTLQVSPPRTPGTHISLEPWELGGGRGRGTGILKWCWWNLEGLLSWGVRGGEVLGLSLWLPSRDLPQTHHLGWASFVQLRGARVNTLHAELACASEYTAHQGACYSWHAVFGEGNGNALQYSCLENSMDREAWQATVHRLSKSQTRLRD